MGGIIVVEVVEVVETSLWFIVADVIASRCGEVGFQIIGPEPPAPQK
jgi:hypothetical protein